MKILGVITKYKFSPDRIHNVNETGISSVQTQAVFSLRKKANV
jgi:hypothetical protein